MDKYSLTTWTGTNSYTHVTYFDTWEKALKAFNKTVEETVNYAKRWGEFVRLETVKDGHELKEVKIVRKWDLMIYGETYLVKRVG